MYFLLIFIALNCQFSNADYHDIVSAFVKEINEKFPDEKDNNVWGGSSVSIDLLKINGYIPLLKCGPSVIPFILEVESKVPAGKRKLRYGLHSVYASLSKMDFNNEKNPWVDGNLSMEWYGGYELAKERFDFLQNKLKTSKSDEDINLILDAMASMGIYALPFLMKGLREENDSYKKVFENMMTQGQVWKDKKSILDWWDKNKEGYLIPLQNKNKYQITPAIYIFDLNTKYSIEEKVTKLYPIWQIRNVINENIHFLYQDEYIRIIKLAKLIGYENTLQFRFLVDLGEEALPYLFLKLKEEKEQFTLPVIEKIMNKKLSPEEVKQHIEEAEKLLNKPKPISPHFFKYQTHLCKTKVIRNSKIIIP
ncbi:MAG: hypothetical protein LBP87_06340 [Planctomycetaceae bacterium]|jgi:hypothetical protein|nr:hypothetical protein [Planctomycetaceae bacterium]